jgi:hypothetical protein
MEGEEFIGFLKLMLRLNPAERIMPREAMNHPFLTIAAKEKVPSRIRLQASGHRQKVTAEDPNEEEAQVRSEQRGSTARSQEQSTTRLARKRQLRLRSVDWSHGSSRLHNRGGGGDVSYMNSVGRLV